MLVTYWLELENCKECKYLQTIFCTVSASHLEDSQFEAERAEFDCIYVDALYHSNCKIINRQN